MHRLLVILIIALTGCSHENEGTLFIQSNDLKNGDLILEKVNVKDIIPVDTLSVNKRGAFFSYKSPEKGIYRIRHKSGQSAFVILDSNYQSVFHFNTDSSFNLIDTNSTYSAVAHLNEMLFDQAELESKIRSEFQSASLEFGEHEAFKRINSKYSNHKLKFKRGLKKQILANPESYSNLLLISWFSFFDDFELYKEVINKLQIKYSNNSYLRDLKRTFESKTKWMFEIFPNLVLKDENDKEVDLKELKSKFFIVEFWNTMSLSYIQGIHEHKRITSRYDKEDLMIVSVNLDEDPVLWKNTIQNLNLHFKNLNDPKGFEASQLNKTLGLTKLPANFILDQDFKVIAQNKWGQHLEDLLIENIAY